MDSKEKITFKKEVCQSFKNAKGWTYSNKFIVSFTGKKANIFDKRLKLLFTVTDLNCVYHGYISGDERKLLLVSTSNLFYVFSLETFELLQKYSLKGRFNYNIEGNGAWNFDNETFLIIATDKYSLSSCVMIFPSNNTAPLKQIEFKDHCFTKILKLNHLKKHLLIGTDHSQDHQNCFVFLQNGNTEEYVLEDFDDLILDAEYNDVLDKYIIYGSESSMICNEMGKLIKPFEIRNVIGDTSTFLNNWLKEFNLNDEQKHEMLQLTINLIVLNKDIYENINKLLWSEKSNMVFGATNERFFVYDINEKKIIFSKKVPFGVYDLVEISDNKIILQTWKGAIIYSYHKTENTDNDNQDNQGTVL